MDLCSCAGGVADFIGSDKTSGVVIPKFESSSVICSPLPQLYRNEESGSGEVNEKWRSGGGGGVGGEMGETVVV